MLAACLGLHARVVGKETFRRSCNVSHTTNLLEQFQRLHRKFEVNFFMKHRTTSPKISRKAYKLPYIAMVSFSQKASVVGKWPLYFVT
jgi:hypothetical protein